MKLGDNRTLTANADLIALMGDWIRIASFRSRRGGSLILLGLLAHRLYIQCFEIYLRKLQRREAALDHQSVNRLS